MKRLLAGILAVLLLFSGCRKAPDDGTTGATGATTVPTVPTHVTEPVETTQPTQPPVADLPDYGLYQPGSDIELQTDGALRAYPLTELSCYAVEKMGEGLLLFCGDESTELVLLKDQTRVSVSLGDVLIHPEWDVLDIWDAGLSYYDSQENCVVFLDGQLQQTDRVALPEEIRGLPQLSADHSVIYFCTGEALRALEIRTGISRLLREMAYEWHELVAIHVDATVLECFVLAGEQAATLYLSAETGETLQSRDFAPVLDTEADRFFTQRQDGSVWQMLYGSIDDGSVQCLVPRWEGEAAEPLLEMDAVVVYGADGDGCRLEYYDLSRGRCYSSLTLPEGTAAWSVIGDPDIERVWFLAESEDQDDLTLYCWDTERSPSGDIRPCLTPVYTEEDPDTEGLKACQEMADQIGRKYGVKILLWEAAAAIRPDDYTFEAEYLTRAYLRDLPLLDQAMSQFPEGFFKTAAKTSDNDLLTVSLVRSACGNNDLGSLTSANGVQFWVDGSCYVTLVMGEEFTQTFYHELFHVVDTRVLAECSAYDNWQKLNPAGFTYDFDYVTNQYREDWQYLGDENRSFIDMYSMSYPKEDRARIMEYAMLEDKAYLFTSDIMQAKLRQLCLGIREAFGLKQDTSRFLWEQYLEVPLAP